jgi:hypothetical protein
MLNVSTQRATPAIALIDLVELLLRKAGRATFVT